jgi:hypothetical protein
MHWSEKRDMFMTILAQIKGIWPAMVAVTAIAGGSIGAVQGLDNRYNEQYVTKAEHAVVTTTVTHIERNISDISNSIEKIDDQQKVILEKLNIVIGRIESQDRARVVGPSQRTR